MRNTRYFAIMVMNADLFSITLALQWSKRLIVRVDVASTCYLLILVPICAQLSCVSCAVQSFAGCESIFVFDDGSGTVR